MVELVVSHEDDSVTLPEHASYSSLRAWLTCQEKWWRLKVDTPPARKTGYALVGGSSVHLITEWWEAEYSLQEAA